MRDVYVINVLLVIWIKIVSNNYYSFSITIELLSCVGERYKLWADWTASGVQEGDTG